MVIMSQVTMLESHNTSISFDHQSQLCLNAKDKNCNKKRKKKKKKQHKKDNFFLT